MTKKKPTPEPELPPGKASFPHWLDGIGSTKTNLTKTSNLTETDRKRVGEKLVAKLAKMKPQEAERHLQDLARREPLYERHAKTRMHMMRWSQVWAMEGMTPAAFKKTYGYKKTLAKIYELVAEDEGVGPLAIKKSCDLVDTAIEAGDGRKFLVADLPTRKLGKKRPRSR
jgi:hypothetical protein